MSDRRDAPTTASEVRLRNEELDAALLRVVAAISPEQVHADPGTGEWTVAQNLAHLAEFPQHFAEQICQYLAAPDRPVGRTHDDAKRLDAVDHARDRTLDELREAVVGSLDQLAKALARLEDDHLRAPTLNVKYGEEPLTTFLDRYVLGHKAAHLRQLESCLSTVQR